MRKLDASDKLTVDDFELLRSRQRIVRQGLSGAPACGQRSLRNESTEKK